MLTSRPHQIAETHLRRRAVVYIRQSSLEQVRSNTGSAAMQRDLPGLLQAWGWSPDKIDVVDENLGVSGAAPELRRGFNTLLEQMRAGLIGLVMVWDASRLARNILDLAKFGMAARKHDVLFAQSGQIVDFRDPNSEFVGLMSGLNAARENRARAQLSRVSRRKKAELGHAVSPPPLGYIRDHTGEWVKHPDARVREVLHLVFDKFLEFGTAGAVCRYFRSQNLYFPSRVAGGQHKWISLCRERVHHLLRDPTYAGTYVFGRTYLDDSGELLPTGRKKQIPRPLNERIHTQDHHEPYVPLDKWLIIQERLTSNRPQARGPLGRGEALAQGLLRCMIHDVHYRTDYPVRRAPNQDGRVERVPYYRCRSGSLGQGHCSCIRSAAIDALVVDHLLEVLAPPSLDVLQAAIKAARRDYEAVVRQREDELRRLERAVAEAERAFEAATSAYPKIKERLCDRYEEALSCLSVRRADQAQHPVLPPVEISERDIAALRSLLSDLPGLWRHPTITSTQKKTLLRLVIQRIDVHPDPYDWQVTIRWTGGAGTEGHLLRHESVRKLVWERHGEGLSPAQIAASLAKQNIRRLRGPHIGQPYDEQSVQFLLESIRTDYPNKKCAWRRRTGRTLISRRRV